MRMFSDVILIIIKFILYENVSEYYVMRMFSECDTNA